MSAKFTNHIREFIASSLLSSIESTRTTDWVTGTTYAIGQKVVNSGNTYVASSSGTAGATPPTHVSGDASDGSVSWIYVETAIRDKLFEGNLFMSIGQPTDWTNPLVPDAVVAIDSAENSALSNAVSLKSVKSGNMKACAPRHTWTSGLVYSQYDSDTEIDAYPHPFFIITNDYRIYKCLDNNSGAGSTSMPTSTLTTPFRTIDGYVWKFMGSVNASDATVFMTEDFIPVSVKKGADEDPEQWAIQSAAQAKSISRWQIVGSTGLFTNTPIASITGDGTGATAAGAKVGNSLTQVYVINPGSGYTAAGTYAIVKDGTTFGSGALPITATVDGTTGAITTILVVQGGTGYTAGATAVVVGVAKAGQTITPASGLTVNVLANSVAEVTFTDGGANYASATIYIVPGTAGAIAKPVMAPAAGHGANIVRELGASTVMISTKLTNTISDSGYYLIGDPSKFHQISLVTDIIDVATDKYAAGDLYVGPSHPDYATTDKAKMKVGSGIVLYINNIKTVTRDTDQEEDIKIAITL